MSLNPSRKIRHALTVVSSQGLRCSLNATFTTFVFLQTRTEYRSRFINLFFTQFHVSVCHAMVSMGREMISEVVYCTDVCSIEKTNVVKYTKWDTYFNWRHSVRAGERLQTKHLIGGIRTHLIIRSFWLVRISQYTKWWFWKHMISLASFLLNFTQKLYKLSYHTQYKH